MSKRELGSTGAPYRKLIHFMTEYIVDGKEGPGLDLERAMLAGLIDDVLRVLHHADDLGLVEPAMREGFVEWFRAKFTRVATPTDTGLREAAQALVDRLAVVHESPEYQGVWSSAYVHGVTYKGPRYVDELDTLRAALSQGGGP